MNKQGVFYYGYCQSPQEVNQAGYDPYDEIDKLMFQHKNWVMMADQGGDLIGIRKLQVKYPGRVFLCITNKEWKGKILIKWGEDEKNGEVSFDRNRVIQLAVDQINEGRLTFNGSKEDWLPFFEHCMNAYRVKEIKGEENDPQYGWGWVWRRKGPDHFFMSMIYALVGLDRFGGEEAMIIPKDNRFLAGVVRGSSVDGSIPARQFKSFYAGASDQNDF
jgi:hypothetical protein